MHPQELEAEVPITPNTPVANGNGCGNLSPVKETKTPMAELSVGERGLGESWRGGEANEEHIVSPNTDTLPSMIGRERGGDGMDARAYSPVSEGTRTSWSPGTPTTTSLGRRQSKFEERWSSERER